jgi:hypothetical protein
MATNKSPWYLLRNSQGKPDGTWTMAWVSWVIWAVGALLAPFAGSKFSIFGQEIVLAEFDWASAVAVVATAIPYVARRNKILSPKPAEPVEE